MCFLYVYLHEQEIINYFQLYNNKTIYVDIPSVHSLHPVKSVFPVALEKYPGGQASGTPVPSGQ